MLNALKLSTEADARTWRDPVEGFKISVRALAAAEVIAAVNGNATPQFPAALVEIAGTLRPFDPEACEGACGAVTAVVKWKRIEELVPGKRRSDWRTWQLDLQQRLEEPGQGLSLAELPREDLPDVEWVEVPTSHLIGVAERGTVGDGFASKTSRLTGKKMSSALAASIDELTRSSPKDLSVDDVSVLMIVMEVALGAEGVIQGSPRIRKIASEAGKFDDDAMADLIQLGIKSGELAAQGHWRWTELEKESLGWLVSLLQGCVMDRATGGNSGPMVRFRAKGGEE